MLYNEDRTILYLPGMPKAMSVREYKEKKMGDQSRRGDLTKMMVEEVKEEFKTAVALVYDTQAGHFGDETCSCSACVFLRKWAHLMR